jgi:hypothetical protein
VATIEVVVGGSLWQSTRISCNECRVWSNIRVIALECRTQWLPNAVEGYPRKNNCATRIVPASGLLSTHHYQSFGNPNKRKTTMCKGADCTILGLYPYGGLKILFGGQVNPTCF